MEIEIEFLVSITICNNLIAELIANGISKGIIFSSFLKEKIDGARPFWTPTLNFFFWKLKLKLFPTMHTPDLMTVCAIGVNLRG